MPARDPNSLEDLVLLDEEEDDERTAIGGSPSAPWQPPLAKPGALAANGDRSDDPTVLTQQTPAAPASTAAAGNVFESEPTLEADLQAQAKMSMRVVGANSGPMGAAPKRPAAPSGAKSGPVTSRPRSFTMLGHDPDSESRAILKAPTSGHELAKQLGAHAKPAPVHEGDTMLVAAQVGRYKLIRRIAVGGMAEVFLGMQDGPAGFQKQVVVKRILQQYSENPRFVDMFLREAKYSARLSHPNIVQIYDLGKDNSGYFIAMEWVDGMTLHRLAVRAWRNGKSLPMDVVIAAIADAALGLYHAHEMKDETGQKVGLVHRDISPDNLIASKDGITKILDFGLAKAKSGDNSTGVGELKGKIPFMAPEQIRGEELDARADIYALGVTLYWLLTGQRPVHAPSEVLLLQAVLTQPPTPPRDHNPSIPPALEKLVLQMLEKNPAKRPQTALAVNQTLINMAPHRGILSAEFVQSVIAMPDAPNDAILPTSDRFLASTPTSSAVKTLAPEAELPQYGLPESLPGDALVPLSSIDDNTLQPIAQSTGGSKKILLAAAAGVGLIIVVAALALSGGDDGPIVVKGPDIPVETPPKPPIDEPVTPPIGDPVTPPVTDDPVVPVKDDPVVPPVKDDPVVPPVKDDPVVPPVTPPKPDPRPPVVEKAERRAMKVTAPGNIEWRLSGGKALGKGSTTLQVPASERNVVAYDAQLGVRTTVPVGDAFDYASIAKGKLVLRVRPFADVTIGKKAFGTTPLTPDPMLPPGRYELRLNYQGKEIKRTVDVKAGGEVKLKVDMATDQ